jgi:hypothetical protein
MTFRIQSGRTRIIWRLDWADVGCAWRQENSCAGGIRHLLRTDQLCSSCDCKSLGEVNGYRKIAQVLTTLTSLPPGNPANPTNIYNSLRAQSVITYRCRREALQKRISVSLHHHCPRRTAPAPVGSLSKRR